LAQAAREARKQERKKHFDRSLSGESPVELQTTMCLGPDMSSALNVEATMWPETEDTPGMVLTAAARRRIKQRMRRRMASGAGPVAEMPLPQEHKQPGKKLLQLDALCPTTIESNMPPLPAMKAAPAMVPLATLQPALPEVEVVKTDAPMIASMPFPMMLGKTIMVPLCALPVVPRISEEKPIIPHVDVMHLTSTSEEDGATVSSEQDTASPCGSSPSMTQNLSHGTGSGCSDCSDFQSNVRYTVRKTFIELEDDEEDAGDCCHPREGACKRGASAPPATRTRVGDEDDEL